MKKLIDQIMRFGIVGVLAFFIDYGVMVALTELFGVYYLLSACISFTVSVIFNYVCSMKFVFTRREDISRAREFVTSCCSASSDCSQRSHDVAGCQRFGHLLYGDKDFRNCCRDGLEFRFEKDLAGKKGTMTAWKKRSQKKLLWPLVLAALMFGAMLRSDEKFTLRAMSI